MPDVFQAFPIEQVISIAMAVLVLFSGIISVLFIIWGWFLMVISGGSEEKVKAAVNHIRHAVIGILFIIAVLYIIPPFFDLLWVEYGDYMRPSAVLDGIGWLSDMIFGQPIESFPDSQVSPGWLSDDFSDL